MATLPQKEQRVGAGGKFYDAPGNQTDGGPTNRLFTATVAGLVPLENSLVPSRYLPSYVDDVLEFAQLSAFPTAGEAGKIYVAINTGKQYRYSGSGYVLLSDSGLTADQLASFPAGVTSSNKLVAQNEPRFGSTTAADPAATVSSVRTLSDNLGTLAKYVIRWDQERFVTLNQVSNTALKYVSGRAYAFTAGTYAPGTIELTTPTSDYTRQGDYFAIRIAPTSTDLTFQCGSLSGFGSATGPTTLVAKAGQQYFFHAVVPDPASTAGSFWQVHSTPSTGSGTPGTARDPYDVDTAKAIQVVDANVPFLQETDSSYYGKKILNRTYQPSRPALYECMSDRPLKAKNSDGSINPTTWWWVRTPIV